MNAVVFRGVGDLGLEEMADPKMQGPAFDQRAEGWTKVGIISGG